MPLRDLALDDRERAFYGSRAGDITLLGLLSAILLGNGLYVWHRLGPANDQAGRAIFWGLAVLCAMWAIIVYTFKLSVCVRVGPHGVTVARGPWRTELAWANVGRLVERVQMDSGQRLRWVVALGRDGRQLQVREDMVLHYQAFRMEVYERYHLWRDHGGTWGTTGGGPYRATETSSTQAQWLLILSGFIGLPGIYLWAEIPVALWLGALLTGLALVCAGFGVRALLGRQTYRVDARSIEVKRPGHSSSLMWRDVARVDRSRIASSGLVRAAISAGRFVVRIAARRDGRIQSFDWSPRVPEYLTLRGAGRQVRVRLHKLERPDEMLAWIEFYERQGRRRADSAGPSKTGPLTNRRTLASSMPRSAPPDLSSASGPADPWGSGRDGEEQLTGVGSAPDGVTGEYGNLSSDDSTPTETYPSPGESAAWLSADASNVWTPGPTPRRSSPEWQERKQAPSNPLWTTPQAEPSPMTSQPASGMPHGQPAWSLDDNPDRPPEPYGDTAADLRGSAPEPHDLNEWEESAAPNWPNSALPEAETPEPDSEPLQGGDDFVGDGQEDAPTAAVESLASAFAPWKETADWQPPRFPRYGPPPESGSEPDEQG